MVGKDWGHVEPSPEHMSKDAAWASYWNRKERTFMRKDVPVPAFWIKPGCIFHTPPEIPERSIAKHQVDEGWWGHPILVMKYDKRTERAEVLLVTTLAGRTIDECYKPGVSMRRRLLYIEGSGPKVELHDSMPTLQIREGFSNMYDQSYVKINAPVIVERKFILHLGMARTVSIDGPSMAIVESYLKSYMDTECLKMEDIHTEAQAEAASIAQDSSNSPEVDELGQNLSRTQIRRRSSLSQSPTSSSPLTPSRSMTRAQWGNWGNSRLTKMGSIGQPGKPAVERRTRPVRDDPDKENRPGPY